MSDALIAVVHAWQGPSGLLALTFIFMFGAIVYVPRFSLYLLGGALFGFAAAPAALAGTTVGAAIAFLMARYLLHDFVRQRIDRRPVLRRLFAAVDAEGWRLVALVRLASPLPGGGVNYLFGVTHIGLWPYTLATCAGLVAPILGFVALGALGRLALAELEGSAAQQIAIGTGVVALAAALALVLHRIAAGFAPGRIGSLDP